MKNLKMTAVTALILAAFSASAVAAEKPCEPVKAVKHVKKHKKAKRVAAPAVVQTTAQTVYVYDGKAVTELASTKLALADALAKLNETNENLDIAQFTVNSYASATKAFIKDADAARKSAVERLRRDERKWLVSGTVYTYSNWFDGKYYDLDYSNNTPGFEIGLIHRVNQSWDIETKAGVMNSIESAGNSFGQNQATSSGISGQTQMLSAGVRYRARVTDLWTIEPALGAMWTNQIHTVLPTASLKIMAADRVGFGLSLVPSNVCVEGQNYTGDMTNAVNGGSQAVYDRCGGDHHEHTVYGAALTLETRF